MKPIGKIEVHGVGFVDIVDKDSLLIGEYFLDYMTKKLNKTEDTIPMKNGDKRSAMDLQKEIKAEVEAEGDPLFYRASEIESLDSTVMKQGVDEYLESDQGKKDTVALLIKSKRGRKKGDMMTCDAKIMKYLENKSKFRIKSFMNRQPRFTDDDIKSAIGRLIKKKVLYQISNEEIGVYGKATGCSVSPDPIE